MTTNHASDRSTAWRIYKMETTWAVLGAVLMKCFNCGEPEKIVPAKPDPARIAAKLLYDEDFGLKEGQMASSITRFETDVVDCCDDEERFMPLCERCSQQMLDGEISEIELVEQWLNEPNRSQYIALTPRDT